MPSDTKSLIDDIIHNTDNSYPAGKGPVYDKDTVGAEITQNNYPVQTFDKGKFREKLSLYVLKDLISAMMADDVADVDGMVDASIMRHIKDDYNGSCYSYLCDARDRTKSPLLSDIIQEVDDATDDKEKELEETKDDDNLAGEINIAVMLKDVTNYEEFRKKLKERVSQKVVDDVAGVITKRNDAPVFDDLDEELEKTDENEEGEQKEVTDEETQESVILTICGKIVAESYVEKAPISTEEGLERAICEYCVAQLDSLFKMNPKRHVYDKYGI
jgi:hypothetical protein